MQPYQKKKKEKKKKKKKRKHYENTPIQIYWNFHLKKQKIFRQKVSYFFFFFIFAQNIDFGYSLEPPRWGGSNEYPQSMFWAKISKIIHTPINPNFSV